MQVKDIMKKNVRSIPPGSSVQKAAKKMDKYGIGSLIITDGNKMKGIVTGRDILIKVVARGCDPSKTTVNEIMTREVVMIDPSKTITDASEIMTSKKIKKLPVIEEDNLVGIVTASDIITTEPKMLEALGSLFLMSDKKKNIAG